MNVVDHEKRVITWFNSDYVMPIVVTGRYKNGIDLKQPLEKNDERLNDQNTIDQLNYQMVVFFNIIQHFYYGEGLPHPMEGSIGILIDGTKPNDYNFGDVGDQNDNQHANKNENDKANENIGDRMLSDPKDGNSNNVQEQRQTQPKQNGFDQHNQSQFASQRTRWKRTKADTRRTRRTRTRK